MDEVAVLVLNYTFEPLHFTNARRAITLLMNGKAEAVEASPRVVRSPSVAFPLPAVIRLAIYIRKPMDLDAYLAIGPMLRDLLNKEAGSHLIVPEAG